MGFQMNNTSSRYEECNKALLPREVFSSRFLYLAFTHKVSSAIIISEILLILAFIFHYKHDGAGLFFVCFFGFAPLVITVIVVYVVSSEFVHLIEANELALLKEITTVKPGADMQKWDSIASKINSVIVENNSSASPYFFYDGDACVSYFKTSFLEPYYERRRNKDVRSQQAGSNEEQGTPTTYNHLDPFVERAAVTYEESLEAYWTEMMNESLPV